MTHLDPSPDRDPASSVVDLIVRTGSAQQLDKTLGQLPGCAAVVVEGSWDQAASTCRIRVFTGLGFVRFALANQGYGTVISEEDVSPLPPSPAPENPSC